MTKDEYIDRIRANVPTELHELDQWVCWRLEPDPGKKPKKVPYAPLTGYRAKPDTPSTWASFDDAVAAYLAGSYDYIGLMFSEDDPYTGVDLDSCVADGVIEPRRAAWLDMLDSYSEFSQSGEGTHTIVNAQKTGDKCRNDDLGVEIYDHARGFVFTGDHVPGTPRTIQPRQAEIDALYTETFGEPATAESSTERAAPQPVALEDDELWRRAFAQKNGAEIRDLFNGVHHFHHADGTPDDSRADLAMCNHLAFLTGRDAPRMDRMFRQTKLCRDKWLKREDYRVRTINEAIRTTTDVFTPKVHTNGKSPTDWTVGDDAAPAGQSYERWTDLGNAERMWADVKDKAFYVPAFGKWYIWAGTHWREDMTFAIYNLAKRTVRAMYAQAANIEDDKLRNKFVEWIRKSEGRSRLDAMVALLRAEPGISIQPDELDREPMMLPCANGTIDLRTGDLLPPNPTHRFTKCLDVAYDPTAQSPLWESFLIRIMGGDLELVSFLQRLIGHALTGDATGKYLVFMYGPRGNNGKSTLVETIMRLLGPYALKSPTEMVMAKSYHGGVPNDVARLRGVRFTVTNEVDEGMKLSESVVKDLTGNDTLSARFMRAEYFDFQPTHKLWLYGNQKPEIRGSDPAIWDRVKTIPFEVEIPESERDPHMADKLAAELPGILTWAVRGCLAWLRIGIQPPDIVKRATGDYRAEQDVIGQFVEDCCDVDPTHTVSSGTIFKAYELWCKQLGLMAESGTKFGSELTRRGYKSARTANIRQRQGIRLNNFGQSLVPETERVSWVKD